MRRKRKLADYLADGRIPPEAAVDRRDRVRPTTAPLVAVDRDGECSFPDLFAGRFGGASNRRPGRASVGRRADAKFDTGPAFSPRGIPSPPIMF